MRRNIVECRIKIPTLPIVNYIGDTNMQISDLIGVIGIVVGIIGIIVGIIGVKCLAANKTKNIVRDANDSTINQAQVIYTGLDAYAVIKLTQDTTKSELVEIIDRLSNNEEITDKLVVDLSQRPSFHVGKNEPSNPKAGSIWFEIED